MKPMIKLTFSAVSHIGSARTVNRDRIFTSGKFNHFIDTDSTQISLEAESPHFLFAVSDNMEMENEDTGSDISVMREVSKFHQKTMGNSRDLKVKADELAECVEQTANLLYSVSLGEEGERGRKYAFTGLAFDQGRAAALSLGNSRVYKLEADHLKLIVNDPKRAERLLKMGIITDEQAEMLSGQLGNRNTEHGSQVRRSEIFHIHENDVFLLCSNGLTDVVSEDAIYDIITGSDEPDEAASRLVSEALENGAQDNVTALILRIDEVEAAEQVVPVGRTAGRTAAGSIGREIPERINRFTRKVKKQNFDFTGIASTVILFIVVAAVVFGGFNLWLNLKHTGQEMADDAPAGSQASVTDAANPGQDGSASDETIAGDADQAGGEQGNEGGDSGAAGDSDSAGSNGDGNSGAQGDTGNSGVQEGTTYKVKAGDSLFNIAKKFYGDPQKYKLIMEANGIKNADRIEVDQVLKIPPAK